MLMRFLHAWLERINYQSQCTQTNQEPLSEKKVFLVHGLISIKFSIEISRGSWRRSRLVCTFPELTRQTGDSKFLDVAVVSTVLSASFNDGTICKQTYHRRKERIVIFVGKVDTVASAVAHVTVLYEQSILWCNDVKLCSIAVRNKSDIP